LDFDAKWRESLETEQIHIDEHELDSLENNANRPFVQSKQTPLTQAAVSPAILHMRQQKKQALKAQELAMNNRLSRHSNAAAAAMSGVDSDSKYTADGRSADIKASPSIAVLDSPEDDGSGESTPALSMSSASARLSRFISELESQLQAPAPLTASAGTPIHGHTSSADADAGDESTAGGTDSGTKKSPTKAKNTGPGYGSFTTGNWTELLRQSLIPVKKAQLELAQFPWTDDAIDAIVAKHLLEPAKTLFASRLMIRVESLSDEYKRLVETCTRLSNDVFVAAEDKNFEDASEKEEQLQAKWMEVLKLNETIRKFVAESKEQKWIEQLQHLEQQCTQEVSLVVHRHQSLREFAEADILLFDRW
jgi:hypothetical protein